MRNREEINQNWSIADVNNVRSEQIQKLTLEVLLDCRDELIKLNKIEISGIPEVSD